VSVIWPAPRLVYLAVRYAYRLKDSDVQRDELDTGRIRMTSEQDENATERSTGRHAAPDGAPRDPRIDLSRDPHPGVPDHAAPEED
jgi:hypothetical protein